MDILLMIVGIMVLFGLVWLFVKTPISVAKHWDKFIVVSWIVALIGISIEVGAHYYGGTEWHLGTFFMAFLIVTIPLLRRSEMKERVKREEHKKDK